MKPNPSGCLLSALCLATAAAAAADWPRVTLASPGEVELTGPVGAALKLVGSEDGSPFRADSAQP